MASVALWFGDEQNQDENIQRRRIRDSSNILELSESSFVKNFRLSKDNFSGVRRRTAVPPILKLAATLKFLAQGGYQHQIGQDCLTNISQSKFSVCITETCRAIEEVLCPLHISFALPEEVKDQTKQYFYSRYKIPGVIGLVDGTHIQIVRPRSSEHLYFNRKMKQSINAMIIVNHNMRILAVNGRFGEASHDSHVWSLSEE